MSVGTAELAPPNEGGDDRDPGVMQARSEEMFDEQELEDFLKGAADVESAIDDQTGEASAQAASEQRLESFEFTEIEVGQKGLRRRYRQAGLGIHAGYLSLQRTMPRVVRTLPDGTKEFVLGGEEAARAYARTMSVFGNNSPSQKKD